MNLKLYKYCIKIYNGVLMTALHKFTSKKINTTSIPRRKKADFANCIKNKPHAKYTIIKSIFYYRIKV